MSSNNPASIIPWASTTSSSMRDYDFSSSDDDIFGFGSSSDPSSSSNPNSFKYDVFISFRGEDTRKNFVDHLYHALKDKGIYTYKDDVKIHKGKRISDDLLKSIQDSKFYIIVFSKNYASSSWCLEELVKIMECHKMHGHTTYPVFYDVEPTQVRKQSGVVGEAFAKHENEEAAEKWKSALKEAADLAGWELKNTNDGHEAKFIKKIVGEISLELRSINSGFDEKLVGMESRVNDVVSSLQVGIDEVRMIGIKGIGGGGKTTTARAVFDHLSDHFEAKSFVENVREVSNGSVSGLKKLQEQVLSDVLNQHITLNGVNDGKNMMKRRMCGIKVLLVLDDVDHIDQLEALAGGPNWFKPGSRIIITTRDEQVLVAHRVNLIRDINLLSRKEAICLFSRYAFGRENPLQGYGELSEKVVRYAAGLPLTVKVLGSFLCGKDRVEWVDAIERLEKIPLKETMEKLELSYTSLEDEYKEIFLDIACILKGMPKEHAIKVLECCGFHAVNGLKVLEMRSLITISSKYGELILGMHDHIEEMGKNIVRREHPDEPNKHSRLWIEEEIKDILANDMGTEATRCLKLSTYRENPRTSRLVMKGLRKMKKLRYLDVNLSYYDFPFFELFSWYYKSSLPNSLKYLKWNCYPYLPKTFQGDNLVRLEMSGQLWKKGEKKVFKNLKFLYLYQSKLTTFDFRITPNLETLSLFWSSKLKKLFMPVTCQKLKHLEIVDSKIRTFDLGLTPNIETFSLSDCAHFVKLQVSAACPNLKSLNIYRSRLRSLNLEMIQNLKSLDLRDCDELVEIIAPAGCPNLERLDLFRCTHFVKLLVACPNLKFLSFSKSRLRSLDLELIPNLETLELTDCDELVEIIAPAGCPNLERLDLFRCTHFVKLQVSASCPNVKSLTLTESRLRSLDLELIPNLERLHLSFCRELVEINAPVRSLEKLVELNLDGCVLFEKLPEDLGRFGCLKELDITETRISHLPENIFGLKGLRINASQELLQLYDFPSEIQTTTSESIEWLKRVQIMPT